MREIISQDILTGVFKKKYGERDRNFSFDVMFDREISVAQAMVSIAGISNKHVANNMYYEIIGWKTEINGKKVTVSGEIKIGDSDGYIEALSYILIVS